MMGDKQMNELVGSLILMELNETIIHLKDDSSFEIVQFKKL